ncbi:MAG TPA: SdrD B-like domain-containing protein [Longilinea sp.]|nr:SdrD B-like domain-containing protein [Longilinea sp.]
MQQELSNQRGALPSTRSGFWMLASITVIMVMVLLAAFPTGAMAESSAPAPSTTPDPDTSQQTMGPDHYGPGINPLTGLPVLDPSMLTHPPALVSISNFPASGRPQSGLSYASVVYEMWIGEGMSRFLTIFYGNYPPSNSDKASLGDFVWSDNNHDGIQDVGEPGVPGVKVELLNSDGVSAADVITDAYGAYHFNNLPAGTFSVKVDLPDGATFSPKGAGSDKAKDSDFDPTTGVTDPIVLTTDAVDTVDCGLILSTPLTSSPSVTPTPQSTTTGGSDTVSTLTAGDNNIGPIRSGRLPYEYVRSMYGGFLVMASAWSGVLQTLNDYTNVYGSDAGDISSDTIPVSSLKDIAKTNDKTIVDGQLSGNLFDYTPPAGGASGQSLYVFYNNYNQFFWRYDPATGGYNRYQNGTTDETVGKFTELSDKISGTPLNYQNVIVLFANNTAKKETLVDIALQYAHGKAALFRDGQEYPIQWTSENSDFEQSTGLVRPIRFTDLNGDPIALKPGQTWVVIVNSYTPFYETKDTEDLYTLLHTKTPGSGYWAAYFSDPYYSK